MNNGLFAFLDICLSYNERAFSHAKTNVSVSIGRVGFYIRNDKYIITHFNWQAYMDIADHQLKNPLNGKRGEKNLLISKVGFYTTQYLLL